MVLTGTARKNPGMFSLYEFLLLVYVAPVMSRNTRSPTGFLMGNFIKSTFFLSIMVFVVKEISVDSQGRSKLYEWLNQLSRILSAPIMEMMNSSEGVLWGAFLLGLLGAVAPCQLTGNAAAVAYAVQRASRNASIGREVFWFVLGKTAVYTAIGLATVWAGSGLEQQLIPVFQWMRKFLGPLFLLTGLLMTGWLRFNMVNLGISNKLRNWAERLGGGKAAFLFGAAVSLGFCPTMATLFFGWLIPMILATNVGAGLPVLFALGTSIPVLLLIFTGGALGARGSWLRKSRRIGRAVTLTAGTVFILLGLLETITYWSM